MLSKMRPSRVCDESAHELQLTKKKKTREMKTHPEVTDHRFGYYTHAPTHLSRSELAVLAPFAVVPEDLRHSRLDMSVVRSHICVFAGICAHPHLQRQGPRGNREQEQLAKGISVEHHSSRKFTKMQKRTATHMYAYVA